MAPEKQECGTLITIMGQVNCSKLDESTRWFAALFNRPPDARPMDGLVEWHHGAGGLQLSMQPMLAIPHLRLSFRTSQQPSAAYDRRGGLLVR